MTVPELIANVLENVGRNFYTGTSGTFKVCEFKRDERQLIKAIATYGYECNNRGWPFQADFIHHEICALLLKIRTSGVEIEYLPVYLAGAIRRHIGTRAEELNAKAKAMDNRVSSVVNIVASGLRPESATRQPSDVEIFASVFKGITKIAKTRKAKAKGVVKETQGALL